MGLLVKGKVCARRGLRKYALRSALLEDVLTEVVVSLVVVHGVLELISNEED